MRNFWLSLTFFGIFMMTLSGIMLVNDNHQLREAIEKNDPIVHIGDATGPCMINAHMSVLPKLEELGMYKWLEACKKAVDNQR